MEPEDFPRINRAVLSGFIQQDPELRFTPGGVPVVSFRFRISRLLPEGRGAGREMVSFITVVAWQELAQKVARDAKNGHAAVVEGFLHSRSFVSARGERRTVVEVYADSVQLLPLFQTGAPEGAEPRQKGGRSPRTAARGEGEGPTLPFTPGEAPGGDSDDDAQH